jgi:hypothetical protein
MFNNVVVKSVSAITKQLHTFAFINSIAVKMEYIICLE